MRLSELIRQIKNARCRGEGDPEVLALTCDSRGVTPGALFAALPGTKANGLEYVGDAVRRGAVAVLAGEEVPGCGVPAVVTDNPRRALSEAADTFYGFPSRRLKLIGVTGTNGKTTVAYLLTHALRQFGVRVGSLGTITYDTLARQRPAPLTTPGSVEFAGLLKEMADAGAEYAVVEVSSHALSQERVWSQRFAGAVFTNLSRDHLDYHGDMESYLRTKKRLFEQLDAGAWAVVNRDDPAAVFLTRGLAAKVVGYGLGGDAEVSGKIVESGISGVVMECRIGGEAVAFRTGLVGKHNAANCLAALAALHAAGFDALDSAAALASFPGVPGRLERITAPNGANIFIDYAHTDDALRTALAALRPLTAARLLVVFGCGGDRDRGKRPLMGRAAEELADVVFVTSDNPRTEPPERIIEDILGGLERPEVATTLVDRRQAVLAAVRQARAGDVVLVAGKGHEDYQLVGTERLHLDDRELVSEALTLPCGDEKQCVQL